MHYQTSINIDNDRGVVLEIDIRYPAKRWSSALCSGTGVHARWIAKMIMRGSSY